jgi:hypothetical protein
MIAVINADYNVANLAKVYMLILDLEGHVMSIRVSGGLAR